MANTVFIPKLWAARLLANLDKTLVYANLCNRDYEGEIRNQGDTVKIQRLSAISVRDYVKGTPITTDSLDGTNLDLVIDQAKYFSFIVEDILAVQAKPALVDAAMKDAAYRLADVTDQFIAGLYTSATGSIGSDASPSSITTAAQAYDALVDLGTKLTTQNVPQTGRWAVIPAWFEGLLRKDSRLISTGDSTAAAVRTSGYLGRIAGFDLHVSNNVPNISGAKYKILAGTHLAMSFAQQITETETLRSVTQFGDNVRGLHVYGAKVVQPDAMAVLVASNA